MAKYIRLADALKSIIAAPDKTADEKKLLIARLQAIHAADVIPLEWVSVNDRLPEPYTPIWAACKADGLENWVILTGYIPESRTPWGGYSYLVNGKATVYAWAERHIPEAPKEVSDNG